LPGRPGHRDVAVDCSFDAAAERLRVDEDDQVELEPLDSTGVSDWTRDVARTVGSLRSPGAAYSLRTAYANHTPISAPATRKNCFETTNS
jgi:hypothetical protein